MFYPLNYGDFVGMLEWQIIVCHVVTHANPHGPNTLVDLPDAHGAFNQGRVASFGAE